MPGEGKRILVLDEFPYAARRNDSLPSVLQAAWDEGLKDRDVMIVLCGSAMSWMEKEVLSARNPLYGRATAVLKLPPLGYRDAARFLPRFSPADRIASYAILGGIPHYLKQFDDRRTLGENVREAVLSRGGVLYSEPEFLLRQELRDPAVYNAAIRVVASGATRLNEIEGKTLVDRTSISTYLKNLVSLGIVRREFPVAAGEKEAANEHRGLYRIADNFWWRDGDEIDIAAFGRKAVLLGECKYRRRPFRLSDLHEFEDKSVPGTEGWETHRYVFSRSGFSADARAAAAGGRFVAVGTEDLVPLTRWFSRPAQVLPARRARHAGRRSGGLPAARPRERVKKLLDAPRRRPVW